MEFVALALSTVPDVPSAKRTLLLDGLDDKAATEVLFQQRKMQEGPNEKLRWDQQMLAAMTLIRHDRNGLTIESLSLLDDDEESMLTALVASVESGLCVATWDDVRTTLPLLRFRLLIHAMRIPQVLKGGAAPPRCLDIVSSLAAPSTEIPALDELSRKLGLPGLLHLKDHDVIGAWLRKSPELKDHTGLRALNTYLLALRILDSSGELADGERRRAEDALRVTLESGGRGFQADFLAAWSMA